MSFHVDSPETSNPISMPCMNADSDRYAKNNDYQSNIYENLVYCILPNISAKYKHQQTKSCEDSKKILRILDIGSGDGFSTRKLYDTLLGSVGIPADQVLVIGLDALPTMIEHAQKLYHVCTTGNDPLEGEANEFEKNTNCKMDNKLTGLHFVCGDIGDPGVMDKIRNDLKTSVSKCDKCHKNYFEVDAGPCDLKFDQILSSCCFQWVRDQVQALKNISSMLNSSNASGESLPAYVDLQFIGQTIGSLNHATEQMVQDPSWNSYTTKLKLFHEEQALPWRRYWTDHPDPAKFYKNDIMVKGAGYEPNNIVTKRMHAFENVKFPSELAIENFVRGFFPQVLPDDINSDKREQFFHAFTAHMVKYNGNHDECNPMVVNIPLLHVHYSS